MGAGRLRNRCYYSDPTLPPVTRPEAIRGMIDAMLHILAKQPGEKPTKKAKGK